MDIERSFATLHLNSHSLLASTISLLERQTRACSLLSRPPRDTSMNEYGLTFD